MFNLSKWLADGLVTAYDQGEFMRGTVIKTTGEFVGTGVLDAASAEAIATGINAIDEARKPAEPPIDPPEEILQKIS